MPNAKRRCRNCKKYKPTESMMIINGGAYCDCECAWLWSSEKSIQAAQKAEKKKASEFKIKVRGSDRPYQIKKAQENFNRFIRLRDEGLPCISCQKPIQRVYAGHYKSVGAHGNLRFNEDNAHAQCFKCNSHLSGNTASYRKNLILKIGLDRVEKLEGPQPTGEMTLAKVIEIKKYYAAECRRLEAMRQMKKPP